MSNEQAYYFKQIVAADPSKSDNITLGGDLAEVYWSLVNSGAIDLKTTGRTRGASRDSIVPLVKDIVMSAPPTVGALISSTGITTGTDWSPLKVGVIGSGAVDTSAPFDYVGVSSPKQLGGAFPDYNYIVFDSPSHPNASGASYRARFMFDGTTLEINFKNYVNNFWQVYVDGQQVASSATQGTGTPTTSILPITFASRAPRLIEFVSGNPFGKVRTAVTDTIWKPAPLYGPRCIILGDSYTGGTGADASGITGWVQKFSSLMGWPDTWQAGVGGSGYLNAGQGAKFRDRVAADITANNPDIVIVVGGHNDTSYTASQIQTEAQLLFQAIKSGSPGTKLIVVGPLGAPNAQSTYSAIQTAIFAAATNLANLTIDTVTKSWFTGTGYQGATNGSGNTDFYIWTDNVHPSQAGHEYLARRISTEITRWLGS